MRKNVIMVIAIMLGALVLACGAYAGEMSLDRHAAGDEIEAHLAGATILGMPDYDWWYGCSPTSVGMVLGKYDRDGYGTDTTYYSNIAPGGDAETDLRRTYNEANDRAAAPLATSLIASTTHRTHHYLGTGYGDSNDDIARNLATDPFDCLADFMGTSQDSVSSTNGSTWFYNYNNGSALHYYEMPGFGVDPNLGCLYKDASGIYGIYEYLNYCGYGSDVVDIYNQYIVEQGLTYGFSLAQYQAEIDAGRPMVIQVAGHSMLGFGYESGTTTIYIDDTWSSGTQSMTWGGSYSGMDHYGVTLIQLDRHQAGIIPEPATLSLFVIGIAGLVARRRRKAA